MYKMDLALSNPQPLICHKTKPNENGLQYKDVHFNSVSSFFE